ncbi:MAG: hypothetical protein NT045_06545 [Candidatus Aureabacteria bacterium]|nr:hypothetical protein [Candidatus Auribacterota bacterium]
MGATEIMVVEREQLLRERPFQGFSPADAYDYESLMLRHYHYTPRRLAEQDPRLKQPIAYCIIVNPAMGRIFFYRRAAEEAYHEKRLRDKFSIGIGGHIDRIDLASKNPIRASMLREIGEEVALDGAHEPRILGYINDDVDMVGKVHFGLLYRLDTDAAEVIPKTPEIASAAMVTVAEWRGMLQREAGIEGWSRIASDPLLASLA